MIRQVFVNLLSNAIKFTRPKGAGVIEIGCRVKENQNIYCVKDNGVGFDMQYAGELFGVFQRHHTVDEFEGTGIGLAIVQRIIHRHGGQVWAEGEVNEGRNILFHTSKRRKTRWRLKRWGAFDPSTDETHSRKKEKTGFLLIRIQEHSRASR